MFSRMISRKRILISSINSGHSAIFLHYIPIVHGPSFWKFMASLIDGDDFVTLINESVPMWLNDFDEVIDRRAGTRL